MGLVEPLTLLGARNVEDVLLAAVSACRRWRDSYFTSFATLIFPVVFGEIHAEMVKFANSCVGKILVLWQRKTICFNKS